MDSHVDTILRRDSIARRKARRRKDVENLIALLLLAVACVWMLTAADRVWQDHHASDQAAYAASPVGQFCIHGTAPVMSEEALEANYHELCSP